LSKSRGNHFDILAKTKILVYPNKMSGAEMILAVLPDASSTETLLNNLSEADFDLKDVSVLMQDVGLRNTIAKDVGPLEGAGPDQTIKRLVQAGASGKNAELCYKAICDGKVLVVMKVAAEYARAAEEMFEDHSAQVIR
jgi:hypothetical protein